MLKENNNPGQDDSWFAKEAAAAMHDYARTVNDAPPLRLAAGFSLSWPRVPRWQAWLIPVTVAAVVVALAVSLVLVRDIRNGGVLTHTGTTGSAGGGTVPASTATSSTPVTDADSVPPYYVAIHSTVVKATGGPPVLLSSLVAGDTRTGKEVANVAAGPGVRFMSVSAAGDDRTFVAAEQIGTGGTAPIEFVKIRLNPGREQVVQVTTLPIKRQVFGTAKSLRGLGDQYNVALSSSGTELALIDFSDNSELAVNVFSVTTGKLLQRWTTTAIRSGNLSTMPTLTWIDNDRELALATLGTPTKQGNNYLAAQTVRSIKVGGSGSGDLIADSTVMRYLLVGGTWGKTGACGYELEWPPVISADGKTFTCTTGGAFLTWVLPPKVTGSLSFGIDLTTNPNDFVSNVLWASKTGSTLILEWGVETDGTVHYGNTKFSQVDVVSHVKVKASQLRFVAQLHFPKGFQDGLDASTIAW